MYLIRKDNKYYLTYSKDVADKFNGVHNGTMCDVELLEEHNIPEKEDPPKYIPDSGKFFNLRGGEYAAVTLSAGEITSGRPLQMVSPFTYDAATPNYRMYNTYTSSTSSDISFTAATTRIGTTS